MRKHYLYITAFLTMALGSFSFVLSLKGHGDDATGFAILAIIMFVVGLIAAYHADL